MNVDKNPKAEIRRPKEGRIPRSESDIDRDAADVESECLRWGEDLSSRALVLHEEHSGKLPLQDLQERTAQFGEAIIGFAKQIPQTAVNSRLIQQLVGAATSVGANYCEADDAVSGKEFKQKIGTCRKESKESMFFLDRK